VLTGAAIETLAEAALQDHLRTATICARIMPEQKLRIVQALKADDETVAMTGDGVNDAPALKAAHIGIAMGGRGTDVAREAAAIVLLDDDFSSIVTAIRLGRRIYDNLRKAMGFVFAVHVPIAGLALLPLVLDYPLIFSPIHIAFLEMIIDPVCTMAFEAETEEDDVMRRSPARPPNPVLAAADHLEPAPGPAGLPPRRRALPGRHPARHAGRKKRAPSPSSRWCSRSSA
jgi:Ca2+-transporting ATPase